MSDIVENTENLGAMSQDLGTSGALFVQKKASFYGHTKIVGARSMQENYIFSFFFNICCSLFERRTVVVVPMLTLFPVEICRDYAGRGILVFNTRGVRGISGEF